MPHRAPLVMIGLDAFEGSILEQLLAAGELPHIARLRRQGRIARLEHGISATVGGVWREFLSGRAVWDHGLYFRKLWNPTRGRIDPSEPTRRELPPFWTALTRAGGRVVSIDVPHASPPGDGSEDIFLGGWQTHDEHPQRAYPEQLWADLERRFGPPRLGPERYGPQTAESLLRVRDETLAAIGQIADIGAWLLGREPFDLFLLVIGGPHRAGHYLWDLGQIDPPEPGSATGSRLRGALHEVYVACDRAVGRLMAAAPDDARVGLFALHGMKSSWGWTERFAEILRLLHDGGGGAGAFSPGPRDRFRQLLRSPVGLAGTRLLPRALLRPLAGLWTSRMHDWSRTRFFALPSELGGCVRVNLAGREAQGIVQPGTEYRDLLDRLTGQLLDLRDLETDAPIVAAVDRIERLVPPDAPARALLPDLAVTWADAPTFTDSVGVRAPGRGELRWQRGRRLESGRSGNHAPDGWLIAAGPGITARDDALTASPLDLVPAICHALGAVPPSGGRTFPALLGPPPGPRDRIARDPPTMAPAAAERRRIRTVHETQERQRQEIDEADRRQLQDQPAPLRADRVGKRAGHGGG